MGHIDRKSVRGSRHEPEVMELVFIMYDVLYNDSVHGVLLKYSAIFNRCKMTIVSLKHRLRYTLEPQYRVVRKPAFCICENKDADQLRGNREADQRLCFRHTDSAIPLLSKSEISSL